MSTLVHSRGVRVKIGSKLVHVVVECPLMNVLWKIIIWKMWILLQKIFHLIMRRLRTRIMIRLSSALFHRNWFFTVRVLKCHCDWHRTMVTSPLYIFSKILSVSLSMDLFLGKIFYFQYQISDKGRISVNQRFKTKENLGDKGHPRKLCIQFPKLNWMLIYVTKILKTIHDREHLASRRAEALWTKEFFVNQSFFYALYFLQNL